MTDSIEEDLSQIYEDRFTHNLGLSAGLHAGVLAFFLLNVVFFPDEALMVGSALRVDLVALPDKIKPNERVEVASEPAKAAAKEKLEASKQAPSQVEEKAVSIKKNQTKDAASDAKKRQADALNKLKQLSALEDIENQVKSEKTRTIVAKGNQISSGSDLKGVAGLQHEAYVGSLENHVRKFWAIPQWLAAKKLRTRVKVKMDAQGNLTKKEIVESSGNSAFDEAVMETLTKASPVPKPPEKFRQLLEHQGVIMGFPE